MSEAIDRSLPDSWFNDIHSGSDVPFFTSLDLELARIASSRYSGIEPGVAAFIGMATALCHRQWREGHSALNVSKIPPEFKASCSDLWPSLAHWKSVFANLKPAHAPVVWCEPHYLQLHKVLQLESRLIQKILLRRKDRSLPVESDTLPQSLFENCSEAQREAIRATTHCSLVLLSGGPGTGKTFTILRCMAAILHQNPDARIAVMAPTGKAVSRLNQSIQKGLADLDSDLAERLPAAGTTVHRFLSNRQRRQSGLIPRVLAPVDWVFVDEASMVDLELMARLLDHLPDNCKVFLIGDIHQLASVDPGAVFSDLFRSCAGLAGAETDLKTITLNQNYRFSEDSPVHQLCLAIQAGSAHALPELLGRLQGDSNEIRWLQPGVETKDAFTKEWCNRSSFASFLAPTPEAGLEAIRKQLILCATHQGTMGVDTLNHRLLTAVSRAARKKDLDLFWCPILILKNDARTGLNNGDIGVQQRSVSHPAYRGPSWFNLNEDLVSFPGAFLPEHSLAFSLTIHKSQGSEAEDVWVFLPEPPSLLLNRELFYTAVSRTRRNLVVVASSDAMSAAVSAPTHRESLLGHHLEHSWKNRNP